jgi:undecaprenyl diphosphate synthase
LGEDLADLKVPNHIGFIMDGNRRWAKSKGLPTLEGHRRGFNRILNLMDVAIKYKVPCITTYAFSTENWDRDPAEIKYLMDLFRTMFTKNIKKLHEKGVKLLILGRLEDFEPDIQEKARDAMELTKNNRGIILNVAFSYGGRAEIIDATKRILKEGLDPDQLSEEEFHKYLYEPGTPDLDLVVRTSGEERTSGFMMWRSAYSELVFVKENWPDFDEASFVDVLKEYNHRERRYGR